ncbi:unnamed protein product [Durusdinium trenchii]|uniref:Uncharacterized protein n=2 Tax=Durusdinium trenchii TaxID=1381693 RepID=A0ABP0MAR9_9DINO
MTIGVDFLVKRVNIPETNVAVELYIVDCGGFSVCQDVLRPQWETANAMMLVYDVANPESFSHLEDWYAQLKYARGEPAISGVVIATKTDLMDRPGCISVEKAASLPTWDYNKHWLCLSPICQAVFSIVVLVCHFCLPLNFKLQLPEFEALGSFHQYQGS